MDLTVGFKCLSADIPMDYAFLNPVSTLDEEGFQSEVLKAVDTSTVTMQWPS